MKTKTNKDLVIITGRNDKFYKELMEKTGFQRDPRIKFVGSVYDQELLKKIRESAYAYLHGHEVGGTNPSLLEALGLTNLNLLLNVGFNIEVAEDSALYWNKVQGNLAKIIEYAEGLPSDIIEAMGSKARMRINEYYRWDSIKRKYEILIGGNYENITC